MNLYELLGVEPDTDEVNIRQAISQQVNLWNQRKGMAVSVERRREAEDMVNSIAEARQVLLDAEKRREYDLSLLKGGQALGARPPASEQSAEPDKRSCPFCGELILATAAKCRWCNEWLQKPATAQTASVTSQEPATPGPQPVVVQPSVTAPGTTKTTTIAAALIGLLLVGGVIGGGYYYEQHLKQERERIEQERRQAESQRQQAEEQRRQADEQRRRADEQVRIAQEQRRQAEKQAQIALEQRRQAELARSQAAQQVYIPPATTAPVRTISAADDPVATVQAYYDAVSRHDYDRAFTYWRPKSAISRSGFVNGYKDTESTSISRVAIQEQRSDQVKLAYWIHAKDYGQAARDVYRGVVLVREGSRWQIDHTLSNP